MSSINKVMLIGHLANDPEVVMTEGDIVIASFQLITPERFIKNGAPSELTESHTIVMGRGTAGSAAKVLQKGKLVYLEGKIRTRSFEDKIGVKRYTTEIIADYFRLLGRLSDFEE